MMAKKPYDDKALADAALRMALLAGAGADYAAIARAGAGDDAPACLDGGLGPALAGTGRFPAYFTDMLDVGEGTGKLPECLKALHDYYLRSYRLKQALRQALVQPLSMLCLSAFIFIVVLVKIFPVFGTAYEAAGMPVGPAMSAMLSLGSDMASRPLPYLAPAAVLACAAVLTAAVPGARRTAASLAKRTGPGRAVRNARLAQVLSMGLDSGMDSDEAMRMAADVSGIDAALSERAASELAEKPLHDVLYGLGAIGRSDRDILEAGAQAGNLPDAMAYVAAGLSDGAEARIARLSARIEPAVTLLGAAMTGGIIILSMLPLLDAMSSVG